MTKTSLSSLFCALFLFCGSAVLFAQGAEAPSSGQKIIDAPQAAEPALKEEPSDISVDSIRLFNDLFVGFPAEVDVGVVNESAAAAKEVTVTFTSDDGCNDSQTVSLGPNGRVSVRLRWVPKAEGKQKIAASVTSKTDPNPQNNRMTETVEVRKENLVDLRITDIKLPDVFYVDRLANIEVAVFNDADIGIKEATVILNTDDGFKDLKRISLQPKSPEFVIFSWVPRTPGSQNISVVTECKEAVNLSSSERKVAVEVREAEEPLETQNNNGQKEARQKEAGSSGAS
jgi:hypothetical protein